MTVQHVALEVRRGDTDAEAGFWALLGFAEVPAPDGLVDIARWLQRGPTQIHLLFSDAPVIPPRGHVAVIAEAFAETCARLAAVGRIPELRAEYWGVPRAYVSSPAGHRVEIMAAPPA